jgi:hypothetical protein
MQYSLFFEVLHQYVFPAATYWNINADSQALYVTNKKLGYCIWSEIISPGGPISKHSPYRKNVLDKILYLL